MSAREELVGLMVRRHGVPGLFIRAGLDAVLAEHAHELAEKIRAAGCQEVNWCGCPVAADLIDPEVD